MILSREGMPYPDLSIYREDRLLGIRWIEGNDQSPIRSRFLDSGLSRVESSVVEGALARLVEAVLERLHDQGTPEVQGLRDDWAAVKRSEASERPLCERLAALGLDPYGETDERLENALLETSIPPSAVRDLLAATAKPARVHANLREAELLLAALPATPPSGQGFSAVTEESDESTPFDVGYGRARLVRKDLHLGDRLPDLDEIIRRFGGAEERITTEPTHVVEAVVQANGRRGLVAPRRQPPEWRFLLARALHHWLFVTTHESPIRLLTTSHDWQQACSRAFAAEFLAPAEALESRWLEDSSGGEARLAEEFGVSPWVIAHQLINRGVS